jgi:hypothetical protein
MKFDENIFCFQVQLPLANLRSTPEEDKSKEDEK